MTYTPTKWVNGGKPAINAENLNKIEEALAQLSVPDITETTSTTQPNSYAGREMILEIGGVTEQDSTAGNQLWNADSLIGVASKEYDSFFEIATLTEGTYTIYIEYAGGTAGCTVYFYGDGGTTIKSLTSGTAKMNVTFTAEEASKIVTATIFPYSANVGKAYKTVMFNKGDAVLSQEKYTGGIPAPNPSYPMELKKSVVSGVKTHGKNLVKLENLSITNYGVSVMIYDGVVKTNGTANNNGGYNLARINLKRGRYYTNVIIYRRSAKDDWLETIQSNTTFEVIDESQIFVPLLWFDKGAVYSEAIMPMICLEEYKDGVEPYKESSAILSQPIDLYGMGGVQDVITPKEIERRLHVVVFDGSADEVITKAPGSLNEGGRFSLNLTKKVLSGYGICSHLIRNRWGTGYGYFGNGNIGESNPSETIYAVFSENDMTVAECRALLSSNPITFVCVLAEPTTEELPIADKIALNSLATYDGITYVEFDSEIQPTFKAEYGTSKVGGYTLEAMLAGRNGELRGV